MQKHVIIIPCINTLVLCCLFCGCGTYDPIPPELEFYEINSEDIPKGTFNIIAEQYKGTKTEYKSSPYIKFKDDRGNVWLIDFFNSNDPNSWTVYCIKNGKKKQIELVLSEKYKPNNYHKYYDILCSESVAEKPKTPLVK